MGDGHPERQSEPHVRDAEPRLDDEQAEYGKGCREEVPIPTDPTRQRGQAETDEVDDGHERPDAMRDVDGGPRLDGEHAAFESRTGLLPQPEAGLEVRSRPPLSMARGKVRTGERRVVRAGPAPEGDLKHEHPEPHRGRGPEPAGGRAMRGRSGSEVEQPQEGEGREASQQVGDHDGGLQAKGDGPGAERSLECDQSHEGDRERERSPRTAASIADGKNGQAEDREAEGAREVAMDHLAPRLPGVDGDVRTGTGRPDHQPAVATRPVGAAEARPGEPHPCAEHDHRKRENRDRERQATEPESVHQRFEAGAIGGEVPGREPGQHRAGGIVRRSQSSLSHPSTGGPSPNRRLANPDRIVARDIRLPIIRSAIVRA